MQKTADEIGRLVQEIRSVQSAMRIQMLLGSIATVLIMVVFGGMLYARMRENLAAEKLQEAARHRASTILPLLADRLKASVHSVLPEYQKLARERVSAITPALQTRLRAQADLIPAQIAKDLDANLQARLKET
ncbi:MAG: hypothetical protein NTW19_09365, partial [Planctomycetota bacterium]|nr:hypothetical protein [Planctomycetota bacterium]